MGAPGTVAHAVRKTNKAWLQSDSQMMSKALLHHWGDDAAFWPRADFLIGRYSVIICECLDHTNMKVSFEAFNHLQTKFISDLAGQLPVITLQTYGMGQPHTL